MNREDLKNLVVYSNRGAQGKTRLSYQIYRTATERENSPYAIVTNEHSTTLRGVVDDKHLKILEGNEPIPQFPPNVGIIFDFGGYPDVRVKQALIQSKRVVIPIIYDNQTDLSSSLSCLDEILSYHKNVTVVVNKAEKGDYEKIRETIEEHPSFKKFTIPVYEIKKSKAISRSLDEKATIRELYDRGNALIKMSYTPILNQFETLYSHLID